MKKKTICGLLLLLVVAVAPAGCQLMAPAQQAGPTAYIDSISPSGATSDETISFQGHGTDPDGEVVAYRWRSSIDGELSSTADFDATLSEGSHTIYLKVQDNNGNWSPEVSSAVVVSAPGEEPVEEELPEEPPVEPPVINSFSATPDSILAGESSELGWDVSGADVVSIDQGVGEVDETGTSSVTPDVDTLYTLTASNAGGTVSASAIVVVSEAAPEEEDAPDLVVTAITRDGSTVKYTIKNQGTADAGPSNSRLFVDGTEVATDAVSALGAGASRTESFSYSYECSGTSDTLLVQIDKDDLVDESNESNNSFSTTWTCFLVKPMPIVIPGPALTFLKPDLTVTAVWTSGDKVRYRVENVGALASVPCSAELYVTGHLASTDTNVPAIDPGEYVDRQFAENFSCMFPTLLPVEVVVDTDESNTESDETNNSFSNSLMCH